jgi:DNA/RNA-binding domain of Phe-tRNA-synthetase-like protein
MTRTIAYSVAPDVLRDFPAYRCGVVIAHGVANRESDPGLLALLDEAQAAVRRDLDAEFLADHPRLGAWRDAFRAFGAKPTEFRPSVEALVRRVLKGQPLRPISTLVDIGTLASLRHLVPIGGHALDDVEGDIELRRAAGEERFTPFGADGAAVEHPLPGEVIQTEGQTVLTRRWVWRQSTRTMLRPGTEHVLFNVDLLGEGDPRAMCEDVAALVRAHCGGDVSHDVLSAERPCVQVALPAS